MARWPLAVPVVRPQPWSADSLEPVSGDTRPVVWRGQQRLCSYRHVIPLLLRPRLPTVIDSVRRRQIAVQRRPAHTARLTLEPPPLPGAVPVVNQNYMIVHGWPASQRRAEVDKPRHPARRADREDVSDADHPIDPSVGCSK